MKYSVIILLIVCLASSALFMSCQSAESKKEAVAMNQEFKNFVERFEKTYAPLFKDDNIKNYVAAISGKDEDFKAAADADYKLVQVLSNKDDFALIKKFRDSGFITDPLLKRELNELYNQYVPKQVDDALNKQIIDMQNQIYKKFNTYAPTVDGKTLSFNDIDDVLLKSTNQDELKKVWMASKEVGAAVAPDLIKLIKLRNQAAKILGYNNFHEMSLATTDEDPKTIEKLFDELDTLTKGAFTKVKADVDAFLAKKLSIPETDLMPWDYQNKYFQEAPRIYPVDVDTYYQDKDPVKLAKAYYKSLGFEVQDILDRSNLYEKKGKDPGAFANDMDHVGDIRVSLNVRPNEYWTGTLLHELGHALYWKYIDPTLPFILRDPAHIFTTEAIAQMFERFSKDPQWIQNMTGISDAEKEKIAEPLKKSTILEKLVFSRWSQVMYRFEKAMYENPDQDLNKLWWDVVEKYQLLKRPPDRNAPDWASKIHFTSAPCYYHNYLMGELLASQLLHKMDTDVMKPVNGKIDPSLYNHPEVAQFLVENVFKPGKRWLWNDMIEKATGEELTAKYYADEFAK